MDGTFCAPFVQAQIIAELCVTNQVRQVARIVQNRCSCFINSADQICKHLFLVTFLIGTKGEPLLLVLGGPSRHFVLIDLYLSMQSAYALSCCSEYRKSCCCKWLVAPMCGQSALNTLLRA